MIKREILEKLIQNTQASFPMDRNELYCAINEISKEIRGKEYSRLSLAWTIRTLQQKEIIETTSLNGIKKYYFPPNSDLEMLL